MILLIIKRIIVNIITNPIVGFILSFFYKKEIIFQNTLIDVKTLSYKNLASLYFNLYESKEVLMVSKFLNSENNVVELGSSIGIVSAQILKNNNGKKIFIEANPHLIPLLKINIALNQNKSQSDVTIENYVINNENKPVFFMQEKDNLTGKMSFNEHKDSIKVEGINLSTLLEKHNVSSYSLVMDIEGSELDLIKLDSTAFKNCKQILAEFHDTKNNKYQKIIDMYTDFGFKIKYQYHNRVFMEKD